MAYYKGFLVATAKLGLPKISIGKGNKAVMDGLSSALQMGMQFLTSWGEKKTR